MVWWRVSFIGSTSHYFCEKGIKAEAKVYQKDPLESVVKQLSNPLIDNNNKIYNNILK